MVNKQSLNPDSIKENLPTKLVGRKVIVFDSTASTNDIAWAYADNDANNGIAVFAEQQNSGRGRRGNLWLSEKGKSILTSILLIDCTLKAELLTLTVPVAIAEAIGKCCTKDAKIKWPNDVVIDNRKVSGTLIESKSSKDRTNYVVGIGINCHQTVESFPPELQKTATSIDIESNKVTDRVSLIKRLLISLDNWLVTAADDSQAVIDRWQQLATQLNQPITLTFDNKRFAGNCIGIDPQQGLIVQLDTGEAKTFNAAQTSIIR